MKSAFGASTHTCWPLLCAIEAISTSSTIPGKLGIDILRRLRRRRRLGRSPSGRQRLRCACRGFRATGRAQHASPLSVRSDGLHRYGGHGGHGTQTMPIRSGVASQSTWERGEGYGCMKSAFGASTHTCWPLLCVIEEISTRSAIPGMPGIEA